MTRLTATVTELWQDQAKAIIKTKGLSITKLKQIYHTIYFPWDINYNNYRFFL